MALPNPMPIGCCTNGPVLLSESDRMEHKFVISIVDYDKAKHRNGIACKTTGQHHDHIYRGEFMIDDFFGRGTTKVQPYNIVRTPQSDLDSHRHIGDIDPSLLPQFETGLRIAIQRRILNPNEILRVVDSWSKIFTA